MVGSDGTILSRTETRGCQRGRLIGELAASGRLWRGRVNHRRWLGVWTEAVKVTVERRCELLATVAFEENFLHRRQEV